MHVSIAFVRVVKYEAFKSWFNFITFSRRCFEWFVFIACCERSWKPVTNEAEMYNEIYVLLLVSHHAVRFTFSKFHIWEWYRFKAMLTGAHFACLISCLTVSTPECPEIKFNADFFKHTRLYFVCHERIAGSLSLNVLVWTVECDNKFPAPSPDISGSSEPCCPITGRCCFLIGQ